MIGRSFLRVPRGGGRWGWRITHVFARSRRPARRARHPFVCCHPVGNPRRRRRPEGFSARRPRRCGDQARGADQVRIRHGDGASSGAATGCRRGVPAQRFPQRPADPRPHHGGRPRGQRQLAAHCPDRAADQARQHPRAHHAARARGDRRLHRLPAHQIARRGGRQPADRFPQLRRPATLAPRARCDAAVARPARGRRRPAAIRAHARGSRLPPARLLGRRRRLVAARLLPVLRRPAGPAHRPVAVRGCFRPGSPGADGRYPPALCRRAQARRELHRHAARRHPVDGARDVGQAGRVQHLRPRPQAGRAFQRPRLCAAARRPARHPGGERERFRRGD